MLLPRSISDTYVSKLYQIINFLTVHIGGHLFKQTPKKDYQELKAVETKAHQTGAPSIHFVGVGGIAGKNGQDVGQLRHPAGASTIHQPFPEEKERKRPWKTTLE